MRGRPQQTSRHGWKQIAGGLRLLESTGSPLRRRAQREQEDLELPVPVDGRVQEVVDYEPAGCSGTGAAGGGSTANARGTVEYGDDEPEPERITGERDSMYRLWSVPDRAPYGRCALGSACSCQRLPDEACPRVGPARYAIRRPVRFEIKTLVEVAALATGGVGRSPTSPTAPEGRHDHHGDGDEVSGNAQVGTPRHAGRALRASRRLRRSGGGCQASARPVVAAETGARPPRPRTERADLPP